MESNSITRKIIWTLKKANEEKLNVFNLNNRVQSSDFIIHLGGTNIKWNLQCYTFEESLSLCVMMYKANNHKDVWMKLRYQVDEKCDITQETTPGFLSNARPCVAQYHLVPIKDLFVTERERDVIINVEMTVNRPIKLLPPAPPHPIADNNLAKFLESKDYSDAFFSCSDKVKIPVHRILLMGKSDEFKKIFDSMKERQKVYKLKDIDSKTMKEVLKYIYTGTANFEDIYLIGDIYEAALIFNLPDLELQCIHALISRMNVDTVVDIFLMADDFKIKDLREQCLSYIVKYYHQLVKSQHWLHLDRYLKQQIYEAFAGNSSSEIYLETTL